MGEPRSFRNSTSSRVENQLKTIKLTMRMIEKEIAAIVYLGMNMNEGYVAIVLAVVESRVLLIRRRSRIAVKQDLDTEEI